MNWRLIISLSVFGVAMGVASVLGFTKGLEPVLWLVIAFFCAVVIARTVRAKHLAHGFLTGVITGGLAPLIQALWFPTYIANNPKVSDQFKQLPPNFSARTLFFVLVPILAIVSGVVLGLLSWVGSKVIKRAA